ncbi:phosphoribosylamine--glycine ligase [Candidatus Berkelbacteria bacterium]|nr:phosphoribosylamine--glycine ligase [Candidatus Berkelbacteria bacterium]
MGKDQRNRAKKSVLLIGGGGREHALAWKLEDSPQVGTIFCVPGNPGIASIAECIDHAVKTADDFNWLADFAAKQNIALTVVGPEGPLIGDHVGIADIFNARKRNLPIFGPTRAGALIEGDKAYAMKLCKKYNIPTPDFGIFEDASAAKRFARSLGFPVVVKNNWPRAGKGVTIADTAKLADFAIDEIFLNQKESGGPPVVIQQFLYGHECSAIAITDGKVIVALAPARDFKRVSLIDPSMTGGLASYSPVKDVTESLCDEIHCTILRRTVSALATEGIPYRGALYGGLMITDKGPKVLEFNCRFGDPETQAILPRLDGDFFELLMAATNGTLANYKDYRWRRKQKVNLSRVKGGVMIRDAKSHKRK